MGKWLRRRTWLGSTPAGTHMSHWWRQEGQSAKTAPMHQGEPIQRGCKYTGVGKFGDFRPVKVLLFLSTLVLGRTSISRPVTSFFLSSSCGYSAPSRGWWLVHCGTESMLIVDHLNRIWSIPQSGEMKDLKVESSSHRSSEGRTSLDHQCTSASCDLM